MGLATLIKDSYAKLIQTRAMGAYTANINGSLGQKLQAVYDLVSAAPSTGLIVKAADESVTSSTTLQNDDHLVIPIAANQKIQFEAVLFITGSSGDLDYTFTVPTGAVGAFSNGAGNYAEPTTEVSVTVSASGTEFQIRGAIANGANAGNITLQWAQTTSNGSATTVHAGSYIKWQVQ